jgi:hypothetical protein
MAQKAPVRPFLAQDAPVSLVVRFCGIVVESLINTGDFRFLAKLTE